MLKKKKISELPLADTLIGLSTIGVDSGNNSVQVELEFLSDAAVEAVSSAAAARAAASLANSAAIDADDKAKLAQTKANLADQSAINATDAAQVAAVATKEAQAAISATEAATTTALEIAGNPTKIGEDNYAYIYDLQSKTYVKTDILVKGETGPKGDKGDLGPQGLKGDPGAKGEQGESDFEVDEVRMSYSILGNIFGEKYLPCDGSSVDKSLYPKSNLPQTMISNSNIGLDSSNHINNIRLLNDGYFHVLTSNGQMFAMRSSLDTAEQIVTTNIGSNCTDMVLNNGVYMVGSDMAVYVSTDYLNFDRIVLHGTEPKITFIAGFEHTVIAVSNSAVTSDPEMYYCSSDDPKEWIWVNKAFGGISEVASNYQSQPHVTYVAVGAGGLYTAESLFTWTKRSSYKFKSVIFDGVSFIALSETGEMLISSDGISWRDLYSPVVGKRPTRMYYQSQLYIIVFDTEIFTSNDLVKWKNTHICDTGKLLGLAVRDFDYGGICMAYNNQENRSVVLGNTDKIQLPNIPNGYIKVLK